MRPFLQSPPHVCGLLADAPSRSLSLPFTCVQVASRETEAARSKLLRAQQEHVAALHEVESRDARARDDIKAQLTAELNERQAEVNKLSMDLGTLERESQVLLAKTRGEVEAVMQKKYADIQKELERNLLATVEEARQEQQVADMKEREEWEQELHQHYNRVRVGAWSQRGVECGSAAWWKRKG